MQALELFELPGLQRHFEHLHLVRFQLLPLPEQLHSLLPHRLLPRLCYGFLPQMHD